MKNPYERRSRSNAYLVHHNGRGGPRLIDGQVFLWLVCASSNQFNSSDVPFSPCSIAGDCCLRYRDVEKACERLFEAGLIERTRLGRGKSRSSYYRTG